MSFYSNQPMLWPRIMTIEDMSMKKYDWGNVHGLLLFLGINLILVADLGEAPPPPLSFA